MLIKEVLLTIMQKMNNQLSFFRVNQVGSNTNAFGKIDIVMPRKLNIGNNCSINHGTYINAFNGVSIGDDVTISAKCSIVSTGIDYESWANGEKKHSNEGTVIIGNHVWLGTNVIILPNVKIEGEYVVVAAGAVVTHDIKQDRCIVAGCPAKVIKYF